MLVRSEETKQMTRGELARLERTVQALYGAGLRTFREAFDPDEMGFSGRREGI